MGVEIGTLFVRRSCLIMATPAQVWREFTSLERAAAWLGRGQILETWEPRLGGRVRISVDVDGDRRYCGGRVQSFDVASELSFAHNWETDAWIVSTFITVRLRPLYDGALVELFHHGFERLGAAAGVQHAAYERSLDLQHLLALKHIVEAD